MRKFWYLAIIAAAAGLVLVFVFGDSFRDETVLVPNSDYNSESAEGPAANQSVYTNDNYGVSLHYPRSWQPDQPTGISSGEVAVRFSGEDGFFSVDALGNQDDQIDDIIQSLVTHRLEPYGSNPKVVKVQISGQEAALIFPSDDQRPEARGEAVLLVHYPNPMTIEVLPGISETYNFFALYADREHVESIGQTLSFSR